MCVPDDRHIPLEAVGLVHLMKVAQRFLFCVCHAVMTMWQVTKKFVDGVGLWKLNVQQSCIATRDGCR